MAATDKKIQIKLVQAAPEKDLFQLYCQAGWMNPSEVDDIGILQKIVQNSALFAAAFDGEKMIGMGRALSDLVSDAYIQDVTVLEPYRKMGIGREIVQTLIRELKEKGVDWIGLIAQPGTKNFYTPLGFEPMPGSHPLKYSGNS